MQPYRPLPDQIAEQIERGRTLIVELDSWYLPDTAATSYRKEHVKSSVVAEAIDRDGERLRYFHGARLPRARGRGLPRRLPARHAICPATCCRPTPSWPGSTPGRACEGEELRAAQPRDAARAQIARRPADNPFVRFGAQLARDLPGLLAGDAPPTTTTPSPPCGWSARRSRPGAPTSSGCSAGATGRAAALRCAEIVDGCKALSFKLARRREFDPGPRSSWRRRGRRFALEMPSASGVGR